MLCHGEIAQEAAISRYAQTGSDLYSGVHLRGGFDHPPCGRVVSSIARSTELKADSPTDSRAMLFHIEFEAVSPVAILIIKVQIAVANIHAGPMVEPVRERSREDGHQI